MSEVGAVVCLPIVDATDECEQCGDKGATRDACPFASEIHNDETPCNCCDACRRHCWMET